MENDRILGYFLEEASEHLNTIEQGLRKLPETVRQPTTIRELFRAAHSIKGSAAMLGLLDVQKIGNQFEANFKLLKEQPQIAVDSQLQSLFLASFSVLQVGIEQVRTATNPYERDPAAADPIANPVFGELRTYLERLVATTTPTPAPVSRERDLTQDPAIEQVFGEYVTRKLAEIIDLCLQPDRPEIRTQIQQICQKLGNLGENFEFLEWTNLFTACRLAIANPANPLIHLGESISIAVKQAQILVLAHRHQEIGITPDLEAAIARHNSSTSPQPAELLSIDRPLAGNLASLRQPDRAELLTAPAAQFDPDAMELNEFANLLGDRLPTEGTWMQDEDFLDREVPLPALGNAATDDFYSHLFEPSTPAIGQVNAGMTEAPGLANEYDEETFYTPDLDGVGDLDLANFWSSTQLATGQQPDANLDLLVDREDYQLQPDLTPALDLDVPGPDFSLDPPISALLPPIAAAGHQAKVEAALAASTLAHIELPLLDTADLTDRSEPESVAPAAVDRYHDDDLPPVSNGIASFTSDLLYLEDLNSSKHRTSTIAEDLTIPEPIYSIDNSFTSSEVDDFEDLQLDLLGSSEPGTEPAMDDFAGLDINPLGSGGAIANPCVGDDFADLDFSYLDNNQLDIGATNDNEFTDLDFSDVDLQELAIGTTNQSDLVGLNLNPLASDRDVVVASPSDRLEPKAPLDRDLVGLNLNPLGSGSLDLQPESETPFDDLDFLSAEAPDVQLLNLDFLGTEAPDVQLLDLDFLGAEAPDAQLLDLDFLESSQAGARLFNRDDFADFDLDLLNGSEPISDRSEVSSIASPPPIELAQPIANVAVEPRSTEPILATDRDATDLNLDLDDRSAIGDDFGNLDLSMLDEQNVDVDAVAAVISAPAPVASERADFNVDDLSADVTTDAVANHNLADLDFNFDDLDAAVTTEPVTHDNLADLDFNFDNLDAAVTSDELTDFGNILNEQPVANLTDTGDLDALLGVAAIGVGGAVLAGGGLAFDDLDALMATPTNSIAPATNFDDLMGEISAPAVPAVTAPVATPSIPTAEKKPDRRAKQSRTFEQTMRVSVRHLNNLNNLVGELVVNRNTLEQDQNRMRQFVEKLLSEVQKLNEVGKRMQDLYERSLMENSLVASRQQNKPATPNPPLNNEDLAIAGNSIEYDPLEMDRFTPIHLLSQKMIELTVRVRESTADIEFVVDGSTEVTRTLRQITGQLQEDLTKSRMVPFAQTADRLQRGVRDNGLRYGKNVELSVEGRDTLIDKVILESLNEPLIHMVNNAIAHGIESTETRQAAGKPSAGKITIRALHQGNQTIISISDDGAGIDTERVKTKAIEKGIITAQQAVIMSKTEAYELLFLPSFSTKDVADELAGRGVGMDVVRTSITEIRGTIATESQLGVGTTFTIRLPLALSIAKALIAVNNKSNIAFPMDGIEDTQDVSPEQIQTNSDGEQCIFWRDELMPFKPLSDLLAFNRPLARNNFYTTNEDDSDLVSILILRSDGNLTAVQVDKITGDQEIVIKPLQGPAAKPLGIAGATVLGDGRIVPIADVMELIDLAKGTISRNVSIQWTDRIAAPSVEIRESMVLIVDDSITVRELLSLTFKRAGYRVEQARDGQEAWDKLRAGLPCDIVFCDIEMPRMDGLEFLSRIQKDPALIKIPIAMLTSRGSDRHRQIASQLGASGYFIKPYLEEALLDAAKRMIKGEVLEIV